MTNTPRTGGSKSGDIGGRGNQGEGEGIRKEIRSSTDGGERGARTRYNVEFSGKSIKQCDKARAT